VVCGGLVEASPAGSAEDVEAKSVFDAPNLVYFLPPEHSCMLTRKVGKSNMCLLAQMVPSFMPAESQSE